MNGQFRTNFLHSAPACPLCGETRTRSRFFLAGGGFLYRCRNCTVEFINPQPDDAQLKKLYSESYFAAWSLSGEQENEGTRRMKRATFQLRLALIRTFLPPGFAGSEKPEVDSAEEPTRIGGRGTSFGNDPTQTTYPDTSLAKDDARHRPRILDVGCATGYFLQLVEEQGFRPFGVEFSAYAAARARLRFGPEAIFQGTLEESAFPASSFAAIAMSDLLEHVRVPASTLTVAERLLKSDGVILVMTPDTGSLSKKIMGQRWTHYKPEHLFYFNRRSLTFLANRCHLHLAYFRRSKKALNLAYLHTQFGVYRHWLLTPLTTLLYRLAPQSLRHRNFYVSIGEMVAILKKSPDPATTAPRK